MNYSSFPEQVDSFIRKYPIQASDRNKVVEYQQLKLKTGRTDTENNRLNQLAQELSYAFIDPEEWNKFQDALINTQQFFLEETVGFIQQKQVEFQNEIDKFRFEDVYNPSTLYNKKNIVSFQGESYIARQSTQGNSPNPLANTQYWAKIAQRGAKGDRGEAGTGLRYKGSYNPSIQYIQDDAVQFGGQMYACLQDNIGNEPNPNQDTIYWSLAVTRGQSTGTREFKNIVHVVDTRNNIPIGISQFNRSTDILHVIQNQTPLSENEHYTINPNGSSIDRISGMWDGTEEAIFFEFRVIKNYLIDPTYGDGNMIQDGTVGREKLKPEVVEDIDSAHDKIGILKEDVDEHKAEYEQQLGTAELLTTDKTLKGSLNELFTNANNLKADWAGVVGSPLLETDTSAQLKNKTQDIKNVIAPILGSTTNTAALNTMANTLNARRNSIATAVNSKGVSASSSDTLSQLATKVGQIDMGVKKASGSGLPIKLESDSTSAYVEISNLGFVPSIINIGFNFNNTWLLAKFRLNQTWYNSWNGVSSTGGLPIRVLLESNTPTSEYTKITILRRTGGGIIDIGAFSSSVFWSAFE
ncbi:hypothetical protein PQ478_08385 [Alkalihalophilus pseudofirmus]|uniref:hypothetical protein n=1 Tax=Alkalihalophilus pseudofirmus TaxID=79885 RepID=UPI00259BAA44|nr:hypothetical protein [Alkalihalophilus pseudofirmus]WEG18486.1 hypothetical protein PQ478_08385 [Alkalihalophilus pseudofirmus]